MAPVKIKQAERHAASWHTRDIPTDEKPGAEESKRVLKVQKQTGMREEYGKRGKFKRKWDSANNNYIKNRRMGDNGIEYVDEHNAWTKHNAQGNKYSRWVYASNQKVTDKL